MGGVDKLVETINQAIQKAGGEAARVWPEMVAANAFGAVVYAWIFGVLAGVLALGALVTFVVAVQYGQERDGDGAGSCCMIAVLLLVLAVIFTIFLVDNLRTVYYPEATLVRGLLGK